MTGEQDPSNVAEPPATITSASVEGTNGAPGEAGPDGSPDSGVSVDPSKPSGGESPAVAPPEDWRDKRFAKTTARMRELERQLEAAKLAAKAPAGSDEAAINAKAEERAKGIA